MRVLYVEDCTIDARLTQVTFRKNAPDIELEIVGSVEAGRIALSASAFDLLLTDLRLPDGTGLDLLNAVCPDGVMIPVVLITGQGDLHSAVTALRSGAYDYVVKQDGYLECLPDRLRSIHQAVRHQGLRSHVLRVLCCSAAGDDVAGIRDHLARFAPHFRVEALSSARAVLDRLSASDAADTGVGVDVILIRHCPPGLDGLELVRVLRQERRLSPPIVLVTPEADEDAVARSLHLGVDDFIVETAGYLHALPPTLEKVHRERQLLTEKAELQALNDRYTQVLAASPALTYRLHLDAGQRVPQWVSENVTRMLGYTQAEALAPDWWWSHLHDDDRARVVALQDDLFATGELDIEYRFWHRSGSLRWIHDRQRLLVGSAGTPEEIVGTWSDVTEEALSSRARVVRMELREMMFGGRTLASIIEYAARQIEQCFTGCTAAILLVDRSGSRLIASGATDLGDGYRPHLDNWGSVLFSALQTVDDRHSFHTASTGTVDDKSTCWTALTAAAGRRYGWYQAFSATREGSSQGVLAVYSDSPYWPGADEAKWLVEFALVLAMAARRSEQDLVQRQAFAALANTQDGILITDLDTAIIWVNQAWTDITGYTPEESLGHTPSMLKSGLSDPAQRAGIRCALHESGYWQGEVWNRRKNGEVYPQLLRITTVRDGAGTPTHYVGVMTDLSRLRKTEDEKERLTHYDPLTKLPNRLLAMTQLQHAIGEAQRHGSGLGVLYLDLDHFKRINDSLGHEIGDQVLMEVARRIRGQLFENHTLARLGGDEFLIVIERLDMPDDAARLASRVMDSLHAPVSITADLQVHTVASIGLCIFPEDGQSPQELLQHSETALYEAKTRGRGQYCFFTESLGERVRERLQIETHLRLALKRNEVSLHYQPQIDIRSGVINGVEALMRWNSAALGSVPPSTFIPVAEQSGLIFELGTWALEEACRQNKQWRDEGLPELVIAVNVSVRQFKDGRLVDMVRKVLEESGLPGRWLEIELTESAFVDDVEAAIRASQGLHELGVKLSLDDFGTGYSSLAYLSRFAFDKIKIDQSFVRDITSNPINAAIANTTIALADALHIAVLAEGVETHSQLEFLRQRGCASMQGYLFSRPLPADQFRRLLQESGRLPPPEQAAESVRTLLLLDDEPNILRALQRLVRQDGYRVLATTDPSEAFDLLARNRVQVVVSDQRMPKMSGTEFLSRVKDLYPDTIRIVLSGYAEVNTITQAVNRGAIYKFFTKPWDDAQLRDELRSAFRVAERSRLAPAAAPPNEASTQP